MKLRNIILLLGLIDIVAGIVFVGYGMLSAGFSGLAIVDSFRALDLNGVINWEKVETYPHHSFSDDWMEVPDYIVGESINGMLCIIYWVSGILVANGILLIIISHKMLKFIKPENLATAETGADKPNPLDSGSSPE